MIPPVREGVRLGIDAGRARIGVSRCDPSGLLAVPLTTIDRRDARHLERVVALGHEWAAIEFVVGLPLSLSGAETASTRDAVQWAERLDALTEVPVRLVDERLSTVSAQSALHAAGRTAKNSRGIIDEAAATVILQHALDSERSTGRLGRLVVGGKATT